MSRGGGASASPAWPAWPASPIGGNGVFFFAVFFFAVFFFAVFFFVADDDSGEIRIPYWSRPSGGVSGNRAPNLSKPFGGGDGFVFGFVSGFVSPVPCGEVWGAGGEFLSDVSPDFSPDSSLNLFLMLYFPFPLARAAVQNNAAT